MNKTLAKILEENPITGRYPWEKIDDKELYYITELIIEMKNRGASDEELEPVIKFSKDFIDNRKKFRNTSVNNK